VKSRIQQIPSAYGAEIHIRAKREWGTLISLPIFIVFWTFGGAMVMRWLLHPVPSTPRAFLSLWLLAWALGEGWALYSWLWTAFGMEVVKVREGHLSIKQDILGRGRTRSFPVGSVSNLRARGIFPTNSYWDDYLTYLKLGGGTVAFDSQGQSPRFGIQLSEPEAQELVRELRPYLPE
jgi:hypothetical protein